MNVEPTKVAGKMVFLKVLSPTDVTQEYVDWMRDEEVVQFLESRGKKYALKDLKEYVRQINGSPDNVLFGIFLKRNSEHIGNIKIGNIDQTHRSADLGLIIGKKSMWGKGYGTEAIRLATKYAFEELNLDKLIAGMYAANEGSLKAFIKAGYRKVGKQENHSSYKDDHIDAILVEKRKGQH